MSQQFNLRDEILSKMDFLSYYRKYIEEDKDLGANQHKGYCCFHPDKETQNPGFTFNSENGRWQCKSGCGQGDIFTFVAKINNLDTRRDFGQILRILAGELGIVIPNRRSQAIETTNPKPPQVVKPLPVNRQSKSQTQGKRVERAKDPIPETLNNQFRADLTPALREILKNKRGITDKTIDDFEIGWHKDKARYTFPVRDDNGKIRNIRLYSTTAEKQWKIFNYTEKKHDEEGEIEIKYSDKTQYFPAHKLKLNVPEKFIICEGEFDCMILWQNGFKAITSTTGGNTWCDEWLNLFVDKGIIFLYDCDTEGIDFAKKHSNKLLKADVCKSISVVTLPLSGSKIDKDVSDFFNSGHTSAELQKLIDDTKPLTKRDIERISAFDVAEDFKKSEFCSPHNKVILRRWRNEYYMWNGRHHKIVEDERIIADVLHYIAHNFNRDRATGSFANDVLKNLWDSILLPKDMDSPMTNLDSRYPTKLKNFLSMGNGVLNLQQFIDNVPVIMEQHTPDIFFTCSLPYGFIANADCPIWNAFLEKVQPDSYVRDFLQEYAGYMLVPDIEYQKFLLFIGEGQNGKSVFLDVITAMLGGPDNVSSVSLSNFQDKFSLSGLVGRLANICGEVGDIEQISEEKLKAIVGGDQVEVEEKYKKPYYTKVTGKHIFSTNHLPRFRDRTLGLWRKMSVIEFGVYIKDSEKDERLKNKIIDNELPGVFLWAVQGLVRLIQRGKFNEPQMCVDKKEEVATEINSAKSFIKENLEYDQNSSVNCIDIYKNYNDWCKQNNYKPVNEVHFARQVYREFAKENVCRIRSSMTLPNGLRPYCYSKLKMRDMVSDDSSYNP